MTQVSKHHQMRRVDNVRFRHIFQVIDDNKYSQVTTDDIDYIDDNDELNCN